MAELWMFVVLVVVVCLLAGTGWSRLFLLASSVCVLRCTGPPQPVTYVIVAVQPSQQRQQAAQPTVLQPH